MDEAIKNFNREIDAVSGAAFQSAKGGDENWNKILNSYGVAPLGDDIKTVLLNSEMKISRGAFPIELRKVYEKYLSNIPHPVIPRLMRLSGILILMLK